MRRTEKRIKHVRDPLKHLHLYFYYSIIGLHHMNYVRSSPLPLNATKFARYARDARHTEVRDLPIIMTHRYSIVIHKRHSINVARRL